jgi:A/G-specific adenine glycosylase
VGRQERGAARQADAHARRRGLTPSALTGTLLAWYAAEGRDLPWRRTRDPYRILVSEVMLQQTQVARVVPRYEAWVERWPDAAALAAAPVADVLRAWIGLGYNRRALRLHEAARVVARDGWPEDLRDLPGVGPYTAAALGAFAFGRDEVAMDTNLRRVLDRTGGALELPPGRGAAFNNAVMDLGATVCTSRRPRCPACPLACGWVPADPAPAPVARSRPRFEDTDRYVRGRVVAALAAGEPLPTGVGEDRLARALTGLERDGLVVRGEDDAVRLP